MTLNESETRAEYIDPALDKAGWGKESSRIRRAYAITAGKILGGGKRGKIAEADYVLEINGLRIAVVEAKRFDLEYTEGKAQAIEYARKLNIPFAFSTNGKKIRFMNLLSGTEHDVEKFPSPEELRSVLKEPINQWRDEFRVIPYENKGQSMRYFAEIAVERALEAIANGEKRILLNLATGTGKTRIAFHVAWKLFQTRWTLKRDKGRRPRILFLADRNFLANHAYNEFSAFSEDERMRISPKAINQRGSVPTNANIFFTIFQTFLTGPNGQANFGQYPADFFDLIIVDECHRGGANDESQWRAILEYFEPAVQLGMTATPRRTDNIDTYAYFGEPRFTYKLRDGIEDGFLTPYKVRKYTTSIDKYVYTPDDDVLEGQIVQGEEYEGTDWNTKIEIRQREEYLVDLFLKNIPVDEKTIIFCANQSHAALIRDIISEKHRSNNPTYCVRVTANDLEIGEDYLRQFQDNEKTIPTILTTSKKLSTGLDARNVRHIVILRPVNSIVEFKQIVGRGTRLFDGKDFFTIHDFFNATNNFYDPEWDGEPIIPIDPGPAGPGTGGGSGGGSPRPTKIVVRLSNGRELSFQSMTEKLFYSVDGAVMTLAQFVESLFGHLDMPDLFKNEEQLREVWSSPSTRRALLTRLEEAGFAQRQLLDIQEMIEARDSDLFDVLEYVKFNLEPIRRRARATVSRSVLASELKPNELEFIDFLVQQYVSSGVEILEESKLETLLAIKYQTPFEGVEILGGVDVARKLFFEFQRNLYKDREQYATV